MLVLFAHFFVRLVKCHNSIEIKTKLIRFLYLLTISIWFVCFLRLFVNFNFVHSFARFNSKWTKTDNKATNDWISTSAHTIVWLFRNFYLHSLKVFSLETNSNNNGIVLFFVCTCARAFVCYLIFALKQAAISCSNEKWTHTQKKTSKSETLCAYTRFIYLLLYYLIRVVVCVCVRSFAISFWGLIFHFVVEEKKKKTSLLLLSIRSIVCNQIIIFEWNHQCIFFNILYAYTKKSMLSSIYRLNEHIHFKICTL